MSGTDSVDPDRIKCVVWDLDGTLWDEVAVESATDALPTPRPGTLAAIDALAALGVLSSIASRSAPSVLDRLEAVPALRSRFLAPRVSWQDKSESLRGIAKELGIAVDALLLVDDSPYERAEVEALLPGVRTLAPEDVPELLAAFEGREVTPESRARVHRYRTEEARRAEGERFQGSREEFLRWCDMRLTVGAATPGEIPRALELAARTHRLNSSGLTPDRLRELAAAEGHEVYTARMTDRFGEYGVIGAALVDRTAPARWSVPLLALSCRVAGRGSGGGLPVPADAAGPRAGGGGVPGYAAPDGRQPGDAHPAPPGGSAPRGRRGRRRGRGLGGPGQEPARRTARAARLAAGDRTRGRRGVTDTRERGAVERELRSMIAEATGLEEAYVGELPADTDLFGPRIGLTSLAGVTLLGAVDRRFGVDVAALDLSLDSLQSIATLSDFVTAHLQPS